MAKIRRVHVLSTPEGIFPNHSKLVDVGHEGTLALNCLDYAAQSQINCQAASKQNNRSKGRSPWTTHIVVSASHENKEHRRHLHAIRFVTYPVCKHNIESALLIYVDRKRC